MKKILMSMVLCTVAGGAYAQNYLVDNPDNHSYFGARVGLDVSSAAGAHDGDYCNSAGFHVGAVYNVPLWMNLNFEPGLHLFYDTFGTRVTMMSGGDLIDGVPLEGKGSVRNFGFRIPFNFGYRFDFTENMSVSVYTGPVMNINLVARSHWNDIHVGNYYEDMSEFNGSLFGTGGFKRVDFQWQFGVGVSYDNYYLTIGGGVGMTNVFDGPLSDSVYDDSYRRNTFNLALGYNF